MPPAGRREQSCDHERAGAARANRHRSLRVERGDGERQLEGQHPVAAHLDVAVGERLVGGERSREDALEGAEAGLDDDVGVVGIDALASGVAEAEDDREPLAVDVAEGELDAPVRHRGALARGADR